MLHPLLESDKLECIHKGKVLLQSSISNLLSINNAGAITLQDLRFVFVYLRAYDEVCVKFCGRACQNTV